MAATYYVNRNAGLDTNPGTQAQPFKTITKAVSKVVDNAGDTVFVEGGGNVYTEADSTFPLTALNLVNKRGMQLIGTGQTPPVLEGGGTQNQGINYPKNMMKDALVRGFEIRNFRVCGINGTSSLGVDSNAVIENCHIHHNITVQFATAADTFGRYQQGINISFGNPTIRNCHIHHIGMGGEAKGIWLSLCHNALIEGNDIHNIRKDGIRSGASLRATIRNNRFYLCQNGISSEQTIGDKIHNNFSYRNATGIQLKHNNDPFEALNQWSMTADQWVLLEVYHNTFWGNSDQNNGLAWNFDPSATNPERGAQWHVHYMNNLSSGVACFAHIRDHPNIRKDDVLMDHNVYEHRPGVAPLHFYRNYPADIFVETLEDLAAGGGSTADPTKTLGWEANGRFMAVDFENAEAGDLNPVTNIPGTIELPTPYGSQVGARLTGSPAKKWQPNVLTVTSSKSTGAPIGRLVDEYGQQTSYDTNSGVDEWVIVDQGAVKPLNHLKWDVYGHQQPKSMKVYSLEVANSPTGPWTMVVDHGITNDNYGSRFLWELDNEVAARYVRFTAHQAYDTTLNKIAFAGLGTGMVVDHGTVAPPPSGLAPANAVQVVISPTSVQTGGQLSCTFGTWQNTPDTFAFQWLRNGVNIPGATVRTYTVVVDDVGKQISCRVTATNEAGSGTSTADPVVPTAASTGLAPENTALPQITVDGALQVGSTATATMGTWNNSPTGFEVTWFRDADAIPGALDSSYTFVADDAGHSIRVQVVAVNDFGTTAADSAPVVPQAIPTPPSTISLGHWGLLLPVSGAAPPAKIVEGPARYGFYGCGFGADSLGNQQIGGPNLRQVAYRLEAEADVTITSVRLYFIFDEGNPGPGEYNNGTGGSMKIELQTGSGSGTPSGTVLASVDVPDPMAANFRTVTFDSQVQLTAGTRYYLVFTNTDPSPTANFTSIDDLHRETIVSPMNPVIPDAKLATLLNDNGAGWTLEQHNTPVFTLFDAQGNPHGPGAPYVNARSVSGVYSAFGASRFAEHITVSGGNKIVTGGQVRLRKLGAPTTPLVLRLAGESGTEIESVTVPVASVPASMGWVPFTFTAQHTLFDGSSYRMLAFTTGGDAANCFQSFPLTREAGMVSPWAFTDGSTQISSNNGGTWITPDPNDNLPLLLTLA